MQIAAPLFQNFIEQSNTEYLSSSAAPLAFRMRQTASEEMALKNAKARFAISSLVWVASSTAHCKCELPT